MNVKLVEGFTFIVLSEKRKDVFHYVDLLADTCTCENWLCRLSKQEGLSEAQRRCKHIKASRECLVDIVLKEYRKGNV